MSNLQSFSNKLFALAVQTSDGNYSFDVESVARSLGITTVATSGNVTIRWARVNKYLGELCPRVGPGDFIPESMVYKLAFKANNEVAEKFQDWLAIEVLPQLRKTGNYSSSQHPVLTIEEMMIQQLKSMTEVKTDVDMLKNEIDLSRNQKAKLSNLVKSNCMKAVGGKKANAYSLYCRVAISEHWKEIKDYFEVAAYEEIPKLQFEDAMELASMWNPSAELALKIKKANNQTELFDKN